VYIPPSPVRMDAKGLNINPREFYGPWLLGVEWGQVPSKEEDFGHRIGSAMLCVIPAWKLMEFLMSDPDVVAQREAIEADLKERGGYALPETAAGSEPPTKAENPRHREDFNRLLDAAVRKPKRDDQT
jgi:hypothetical protein